MQDVADRAGVSRALVSLVFRDSPKVSAARRELVLQAAHELQYRPNAMARGLAAKRSQIIGVVVDDLGNPFFTDTLDGLQAVAEAHGYRVLIANGSIQPTTAARAVDTFLEFRPDGIVVMGARVSDEYLVGVASQTAVVAIANMVDDDSLDWLATDEIEGSQLVVDHLVALGHRDIAHIDGGTGAGAQRRRAGYEKAMGQAGLAEWVRVVHGDFTEASGVAAAEQLMHAATPPTAIFAANDIMASGVVHVIESTGRRVPNDVSVIGYDNAGLSAMAHLQLTTVDQPRADMGRRAMEALIERIEAERTEPVHSLIRPTLVVRRTTGPARQS